MSNEYILNLLLPIVQVISWIRSEIEPMQEGACRAAQLNHRQSLAGAILLACGERDECRAVVHQLLLVDDVSRWQRVLVLREPAIWPEGVRERREFEWVSLQRVEVDANLGLLWDVARKGR